MSCWDKVLVRNHTRNVWDQQDATAYHVVQVMGRQLEFIIQNGMTQKVNVQDVKSMYFIDELIKCLTEEKALQHAARYQAHLKLMDDLQW